MKKIGILLLVVLGSLLLISCKKDEIKPEPQGDTVAPAFLDLVGGKLTSLSHLQGTEVDLLEGVRALDDVDGRDVEITITELDGYVFTKFGEYELTYQAMDKAGNKTEVKRNVEVKEVLDVRMDAVLIADDFVQFDYNNETAFEEIGTGARFRTMDMVQVMDIAFFLEQLVAHEDTWKDRGGYPIFPYATIVLVNDAGEVKYARFAAGVGMEIDKDGVVDYDRPLDGHALPWTMAKDGFANMKEDIIKHMPEGGKIIFAAPTLSQDSSKSSPGRIFLGKHLFSSTYVGGGMFKDNQDVDVTKVNVEFAFDHSVVIEKPADLDTPVLRAERNVLLWDAIPGALGYELYIDDVKQEDLIIKTSFDLLSLELSEEGSEGYKIQVLAVTDDVFAASNSAKSEALVYKRAELIPQVAPVLTVEGTLISWEASEGAQEYEVNRIIGGVTTLVATVQENSFDVAEVSVGFEGTSFYNVVAVGKQTHSDSPKSANVTIKVDYVLETMTIGGMKTQVAVTTAANYFGRRNATDDTKLEAYVYKVTDVNEYEGAMTEAFSFLLLLDKEDNVKLARNILVNQYNVEKGWHADTTEYAANNAQLNALHKYIAEGDYLLIGKNGLQLTVEIEGTDKIVDGREFLAYHFTKAWADVTVAPVAPNGWRAPVSEFVNPNEVEFTIE